MTEEIKPVEAEAFIEVSYKRGYNLGKFGDIKEYVFKISGNQSVVEEQIKNQKTRLTKYIKEVENMVTDAHAANLKKAEAEAMQTDVQP